MIRKSTKIGARGQRAKKKKKGDGGGGESIDINILRNIHFRQRVWGMNDELMIGN